MTQPAPLHPQTSVSRPVKPSVSIWWGWGVSSGPPAPPAPTWSYTWPLRPHPHPLVSPALSRPHAVCPALHTMRIPSAALHTPALAGPWLPLLPTEPLLPPPSHPLGPSAGYIRLPTISQSTTSFPAQPSAPAGTLLATCPQKLKPRPGPPPPVPTYLAKLAVASSFPGAFAGCPIISTMSVLPRVVGAPLGLQP